MDDELFNNTRLRLASALWYGRYLSVGRLVSFPGGDRTQTYASALIQQANVDALLVARPRPGVTRTLTVAKVEAGARATGFHPIRDFRLPDGRPLFVWWRDRVKA